MWLGCKMWIRAVLIDAQRKIDDRDVRVENCETQY